jgi:hypothetical protein
VISAGRSLASAVLLIILTTALPCQTDLQAGADDWNLLTLWRRHRRGDGMVNPPWLMNIRISETGQVSDVVSSEITPPVNYSGAYRQLTTSPHQILVRPHRRDDLLITVDVGFHDGALQFSEPRVHPGLEQTLSWPGAPRIDRHRTSPSFFPSNFSPDGRRFHLWTTEIMNSTEFERLLYRGQGPVHRISVCDLASSEFRPAFDGRIDHRAIFGGSPEWSPDSRRLAFHTGRPYDAIRVGAEPLPGQDRRAFDFQVWDAETGQTHAIVPRGYREHSENPGLFSIIAWSSDSQRVLFLRCDRDPAESPDAQFEVWMADLTTDEVGPVPFSLRRFDDLLWSPTGDFFIASGQIDEGECAVFQVQLEDGSGRLLWQTYPRSPDRPSVFPPNSLITPDGRWLIMWRFQSLFVCDLAESSDPTPRRIFELPEYSNVRDALLWTPTPLPQGAQSESAEISDP